MKLLLLTFLFTTSVYANDKSIKCYEELREYTKAYASFSTSIDETFRWYDHSVETYRDIAAPLRANIIVSYNFALTAKRNANTLRSNFDSMKSEFDEKTNILSEAFFRLEDCMLNI